MTTFAQIVNGQAIDVTTIDPTTIFHPAIASLFITVPDGTENGATQNTDGTFTNPVLAPSPPPAIVFPQLTPMQFYVSFKPSERILIRALAGATTQGIAANSNLLSPTNTAAIPVDPNIVEFWETYLIAKETNSLIDMNLISTQEGLKYLSSPNAPTPQIITEDRILQISNGVPQ
jgi:hypothetical protein